MIGLGWPTFTKVPDKPEGHLLSCQLSFNNTLAPNRLLRLHSIIN